MNFSGAFKSLRFNTDTFTFRSYENLCEVKPTVPLISLFMIVRSSLWLSEVLNVRGSFLLNESVHKNKRDYVLKLIKKPLKEGSALRSLQKGSILMHSFPIVRINKSRKLGCPTQAYYSLSTIKSKTNCNQLRLLSKFHFCNLKAPCQNGQPSLSAQNLLELFE